MSSIGLPTRDDAYIAGVADGKRNAFLMVGIEDADPNTGVLTCRVCGRSNADNDPPEDDKVRHARSCGAADALDLPMEVAQ